MSRAFTEQALLHTPGSRLVYFVGAVFALAGAGVLALGLGRDDPREGPLGTFLVVFGGVFLAAGLGLVVQRLLVASRTILVDHASDAVPDLDDAPILAEGSHTESTCAYRLIVERNGGVLIPDPRVRRLRLAGIAAFGLAFYAGLTALIFAFRPLEHLIGADIDSDLAHGVAAALAFVPLAAALGIIAWMVNRALASRVSLRFGPAGWAIQHDGVDLVCGTRDDLLAVQAIAARDQLMVKSGSSTHRTVMDALEVILAWRTDAGVQRATLFRSAGAFPRTVRTASSLAETLGVPFVFHGTAEDWAQEHARARRRRPRTQGSL